MVSFYRPPESAIFSAALSQPRTTTHVMRFRLILVFFLSSSAAHAAINMARVVGVTDSRTIVVEADGRRSIVALTAFAVPAVEEPAAASYLREMIGGAWVYIEGGDVYRSPDGLYVNGEMQRHAWHTIPGMRYLGLAIPAPPSRARPPAAPKTTVAAVPKPPKPPRTIRRRSPSATTASRSRRQ
jgi:hypothetical protein